MNFADRVEETTTATSTTTITLLGAAAGYRPFNTAPIVVGATKIPVLVTHQATGDWEAGLYTLTSSGLLTRERVVSSANGGDEVAFAAGTKRVVCSMLSELLKMGMVDPDDVGYDIVGVIGQSNMESNPDWDALIDFADNRLSQFGGTSVDAGYRKIISGSDPMHMYNSVRTGKVGPASWFGRAYANSRPASRRVLLVPVAAGSTGMVSGSAEWGVGGILYNLTITQANLAITAAQAVYPNSRYVGTVMAQGESDATNSVAQATYVTACKAVIAGLRAGITGAANSWFIISGMVPEKISANPANYGAIDLAHKQVCTETDRCLFVAGPSGYDSDVHYTAPGVRVLGTRLGLATQAAARYTFVDVIAPVQSSAVVQNAAPTLVVISYTEALDPAFVPATSAYTVGGHTVSAVAVSGSSVTLTVDAFVNGEAARNAGYTKPGSNQLRDLAGNEAATFSGLAITNNVAPVDSTKPTFVSAVVENAAPTLVVITYSETLAAFTPATSAYAASGKTVTNVARSGATITLTVNTAYVFGDTPTVTYTKPGSNQLRDAADNETDTHGPSSVTNNVAGATFATWNPADKSSDITLSNGNKTMTMTGASDSYTSARSTVSKAAGKWYWENTVQGSVPTMIGIGKAAANLNSYTGNDANGWGYLQSASKFTGGSSSAYGASFVVGDVIAVALDLDAGTVTMYKNNVSQGVMYTGLTGTFFAMNSVNETSPAGAITTNFGATAFAYTPPTGFVGLSA